ncbi:DUF3519 domain-containing protein [Helicobacter pylori]
MKLPKALNEATAGAALKYHIKRALERSHSISDFSKQLELSAQNAKFSNNTLKIIEELNNGVKQASEEIKEKARDFSNEKLTNEQIKELLNNAEIPKSGRDAITFGANNLNPEIVEFLHKNNKKMIIEKASNKELELLKDANFKHPKNIRASLDHDAIAHILKRYGVNSVNVKNGEIPVTYDDIANYRYIVNNADVILRTLDKYDKEAITAFKQINGYAVVVEQAINKKNELALKTMYKNNGSYKNNEVYKEFSSTSLDADAKVRHGLSSHSGATENPTQKPLTDQEDLLKNTELENETTKEATNLSPLEQANAEKLAKLQHAITPLKEFGKNYPEFALKPKEALEKLLQEKNGQVAGAAFREDLGGIDFVWGNKDYGLEHILEKRKKQYKRLGLTNEQAKERTNELIKKIPNIIQKGLKEEDKPGYAVIILNNSKVVLSKFKGDNELKNHYMITSFEADDKVLRELETIATLSNDYRDGINYSTSNLIEPNPTTNALKSQTPLSPLEQANAEKLAKLQHAITPLKEFGKNYPEFALKPKEALEKLLQEKNGQVAGAAFREDLGGIDFVWGNKDYGLEHILKRREDQAIAKGLSEAEAKEYALNVVKSIPEIIEKGIKVDNNGRIAIEYQNIRVGLKDNWKGEKLTNHWVITSYEKLENSESLYTSPLITKSEILPLNSNENPTQKPLSSQEDLLKTSENLNETPKEATKLSPLEQANAEKLAKLQREQEQSEQEFLKAKEQENKRKEALKKKLEHERGNAGNIESQTKIEVGEDIPTQTQAQLPKSRVRLNEREIYDLDYAIVKAKDLKPSFTTGGTQKRTDMNEEQIKSIAENFDPKKIFGSGGFEDLPIILHDGQVIAGNHRIQGMLNFTPKSRFAYEKAIREYYHIDLKPDELLVRVPHNRLNNTEINNLAASSNQGRFNSESDHAIAVLSHYEAKLKELDQKLDADSIYSLKNIVAKNLNFDKATHPNVTDSNLALLMFNMPRTKTQGIELLNRWQKEFSNDIKSYEKVKKMFVDNAGSFHNLIHDMNFPKVSLNAYLSDIMDRSFANLKNYQSTSESLKDLSEKFYKTSSLEMFEKSEQNTSDISEILGGAIARFARFDDPSKALFEALKSDNIKKGLKDFKIADVTKDMFNPDSKEFKDIDIYDFTHYLLMVNREPNENNPTLKRLIEAIKDMQKESEKGIKQKQKTPSEWGHNYSEFKNDGLGAINKLLETKKGFVAGAFHKEGLGDIDLVWGNKDYGLEHILKRRESDAIDKGMSKEEAKKYALKIINNIPNIISNGKLSKDNLGRLSIEFENQRVGLNDSWKGETLNNRWVITSYEIDKSRNGLIESPLAPNYKGKDTNPLNLDNPNPTTKN